MKIFKKDIESRQGVISANQTITKITITAFTDGIDPNSNFPQPAQIEIALFKDKDAIINQKARLETLVFEIPDISQLQNYQAVVQEILGLMITNENSPVYNAQIEDTNQ